MTQKDLKLQRLFHISAIALNVGIVVGGIIAYNRWTNSATAAAIERNAPKILDQAGAVDSASVERAGAVGSFLNGAFS